MWGVKPPPKKGGGLRQSPQVFSCFYAYIGGHKGNSPHPKPPVPTYGLPRLLGGFKGLSHINICSAVVFYTFLGDF